MPSWCRSASAAASALKSRSVWFVTTRSGAGITAACRMAKSPAEIALIQTAMNITLEVHRLAALEDNYIFLVVDEAAGSLEEGLLLNPTNATFAILLARIMVDRNDPRGAAEVLFKAEASAGFSVDEIAEVLRAADIKFTTTPENTEKYAAFMQQIGSITHKPASWRDLFFAEIHGAPGS